ncbi:MAG: gliding motility-associated C-terminal domain-containing protein, partial [Flavobacteriales bacterium]|nr:gliding motility-associated C-terminal domain-containing protein [Flavobacteriales bacterium]
KRKVFQTGLYWAEVTIGNCTKRDSIFVTVLPDITLDLGPDSTLCFGDTLSLDITNTGASYLWEDNSTNPKRKVFQTGLYWAEITNGYCKRRDSLIVTVLPELTFSLGKDTVFCGTVNLTIDITTPGASYLWEDNSISPLRTITQPGLYWVELSKDGCKKRDSIRITKSNTLNLFIGNDTTICYNESILLDPKITSGSFLWQDGSVNQTYTAKFSGLYWVEVNSMGCMSRDSIQVTVNPKIDLELGNDTGLCVGDNILLSNQLASTGTFLWNDGSNGISLLASNPGLYYVQLNQGDCYERDSINIIEYQSPQINLPIDTFICLDESFVLDAFFEGASYLWNTGSISSKLVVLDSGLYSVSVTNACGTIKDSIYIDGKDCNCRIYLPNVITPNNDGLNDEFIPVYQCEIAEYELLIFNRWGNLLFTSTNVDLGWDGRFQGENASLGSYVYTIKFKVESENKYRRYLGSFTILK